VASKNETFATFLLQCCGSGVPQGLVTREALKQGSTAKADDRNRVPAGVSAIQNPEVFNRRGFQANAHKPSGNRLLHRQNCGIERFSQLFPQG